MQWMRDKLGPEGLAIASGLLYGLLLPPFGLGFLAFVVLVPLLLGLAAVGPARGARLGLGFGSALCLSISWWFPGMLQGYFGVGGALSIAGLLGLGLLSIALPYALFGCGVSWLAERGAAGPLRVAVLFAATEYLRGNLGFANPFGLIGYALVDTPWVQTADLFGIYGVALIVVAVNAALAGLAVPALRGAHPLRAYGAVGAVCVLAVAWAGIRSGQRFATGEPIRVALVQGALEPDAAGDVLAGERRFRRYLDLSRRAGATRPALVFWPEHAVSDSLADFSPERDELLRRSWLEDVGFVVGAPHPARSGPGGPVRYVHNSVFLVEGGALGGRYDKTRLVPLAEANPLAGWLGDAGPPTAPGRGPVLLEAAVARIGTLLCSEGAYPDVARGLVRRGAELLANPANDFWFGHAAPAAVQLQMASVRAIETRRYLVRPAATGFSAVVDAHGRALAVSGFGGQAVLDAEVHRARGRTPYVRYGDWPLGVASLLVLLPPVTRRARAERLQGGT